MIRSLYRIRVKRLLTLLILITIFSSTCTTSSKSSTFEKETNNNIEQNLNLEQNTGAPFSVEQNSCIPRDAQKSERWIGDIFSDENLCPVVSPLEKGAEEALEYVQSLPPPTAEEWAEELKIEIKDYDNFLNGAYANLYFSDRTTPLGAVCWAFWERRYISSQIYWWRYPEGVINSFPDMSDEVRELSKSELADRSLQSITENIVKTAIPDIEITLNNVGIGNSEINWKGDKSLGDFTEEFLMRLIKLKKFGKERLEEQGSFTDEDISIIYSGLRVSSYRDILTDEVDEIITSPEPKGCSYNHETREKYRIIEKETPLDLYERAEYLRDLINTFEKIITAEENSLNNSDPSTTYGALCWVIREITIQERIIFEWHIVEHALTFHPEIEDQIYDILQNEIKSKRVTGMLDNIANVFIPEAQQALRNVGIDSDKNKWQGEPILEEYGTLLIARMYERQKTINSLLREKTDISHGEAVTNRELNEILHIARIEYDKSMYEVLNEIAASEPLGCVYWSNYYENDPNDFSNFLGNALLTP